MKEIWIEFDKWMTDIFGLHKNFDKYSILFGKYDNSKRYSLDTLKTSILSTYSDRTVVSYFSTTVCDLRTNKK